MATAFEGPRRKLERARLHIESFRFHERRFFAGGNYEIVGERKPDSNHHIFKLSVKEQLPDHRFAAVIGDAIHNLRSALDHLAWQLAEDFSGAQPGDKGTQFPAFLTEPGYKSRGLPRIARLGPNAQARIKLLQPFTVAGRELVHPLWLISDLDNRDKHKNLTVTASTMRGYTGKIYSPPGDTGTYQLTISQEDLADGDLVGELLIDPPHANVAVEAVFDLGVVLTAPSVPDTRPRVFANVLLARSASWVEGVLDAFEPFYINGSYDDDAAVPDIASYHWAPPPPHDKDDWLQPMADGAHEEFALMALARLKERLGDKVALPGALDAAAAGLGLGMELGSDRAWNNSLELIERLSF